MSHCQETAPEDPARLKAMVLSLQSENEHLKLLVAKLQRMQFGRRAESLDEAAAQLPFLLGEQVPAPALLPSRCTPSTVKQIPSRKPLPPHLPREEYWHAPMDSACTQCGGALRAIGEDICETLEYVPARFKVIRHVRPKMACHDCNSLLQAPAPERPIARGIAGPALLAQVLVAKYCDHLPLYRQSQIYARDGVDIPRSTLADWVRGASDLLTPLVEAVRRHILSGTTLHADDTPVPVLAPGQGRTKTGRLWTYVRDERPCHGQASPAVWFAYTPDRKGVHPKHHLHGYQGVLHADGYAGFNGLYDNGQCLEAACWAHVRRKFYDVHVAQSSPLATQALAYIQQLYQIEATIRGRPPDERGVQRQHHAAPILLAMNAWLQSTLTQVSRKCALAGAIRYALSRWQALTRYCDDGHLEIDNNAAERSLRSVALGRKNYLFVGSDKGGERAAALYTLIGTARLNGLEPMAYLRDVLACIATHPINRIDELLPWNRRPQVMGDTGENAAA